MMVRRPSESMREVAGGAARHPLTVAVAVAVIGGAVTVLGFFRGEEERTKAVITSVMERHCDTDVDIAHPKLRMRYVPRTEVQSQLNTINRKQDMQQAAAQRTLDQLRAIRRQLQRRGR